MKNEQYNRGLSSDFITDLKSGVLNPILTYVWNDQTLDFQIRADYVNIYYRGGSILKISKSSFGKSKYNFDFDEKYFSEIDTYRKVSTYFDFQNPDWFSFFPKAKQAMDFYFTTHRKEEREYQQVVVRENNYSKISNSTDYFIADIEYDNRKNARFDLVAVEWISKATCRKLQSNKPKLTLIEMKAGDGAHAGKSGITKHIADISDFISSKNDTDAFKIEMLRVFKQKRELNLIPCLSYSNNKNVVKEFDDEINVLFLIANHDPESTVLFREIQSNLNFQVLVCHANYMGYGIFKDKCKTLI